MATIANLAVELTFRDNGFRDGMQGAADSLSSLDKQLGETNRGWAQTISANEAQLTSWGKGLMGVGTAIVGAIATPMFLGAKAAWGQVDAVEQATVALRAYEQDGDKVNQVLSDLVGYAQSDLGVLFQRQDLFQSAQMLKMYGAETENLSGYVEILSRSVGLGLSNWDDLNRVVGRVGSTGRLTGNDFDYLKAAGFELDDSLRNTNMTWEELMGHLEQGIPADALAGQADTIRGKTIRLQSALRGLGLAFLGVDADTSKFIEGGLGDTLMKGLEQARAGFIALRPAAAVFGDALANVARHISSAIDWILKLPQPVLTAITVFSGFAGAAMVASGAFLLMLPRIANTVLALQRLGGLTGILGKVATALRAITLTNPLFWVMAAAIGAVVAYQKNFLGFGDAVRKVTRTFRDFGTQVRQAWRIAGSSIGGANNVVTQGLLAVGNALKSVDFGPFTGLARTLGTALIDLGGRIQALVYNFQQFKNAGVDPVTSAIFALGAVFPGLRSALEPLVGVVDSVKDAFDSLRGALRAFTDGDFELGFARLGEAMRSAWDAIVGSFESGRAAVELAFQAIGRAARGIGEGVMAAIRAIDWSAVGGALLTGLEGLISFVAGFVLNLGRIVVSVAGWLAGVIPDVWAWLRDTAIPAIGSALVSLPSVVVDVLAWAAGAIPNIWSWLSGIVIGGTYGDGTGGATAGKVGQLSLGDVAVSIAQWIAGAIDDVWTWLQDTAIPAMGDALVDLGDVIVNITSWAEGEIVDIYEAIKGWVDGQLTGRDWSSTGTIVGNAIRDAVRDGIQSAADLFAVLLSWISDQIRGVNWSSVGSTFAELLVAGIKGIVGLVGLAAWLLGQILLAIVEVDWSSVGSAFKTFLSSALTAIVDFLTGFATTIYNEIYDELSVVNWAGLGSSVKTWAADIWQGITDALQPIIDAAVVSINFLIDQLNKIPGVDIPKIGGIEDIGTDADAAADKVLSLQDSLRSLATGGIFAMDDRSRTAASQVGYTPYADPYNPTEGGGGSMGGIEYKPLSQLSGALDAAAKSAATLASNMGPANNQLAMLSGRTTDVTTFGNVATEKFASTGNSAKSNLQPIGPLAAQMAASVTGSAIPAFTQINSVAQSSFNAMRGVVQASFSAIQSIVTSASAQASSAARSQFSAMASSVTSQVNSMASQVQSRISSMSSTVTSQVSNMASTVQGRVSSMQGSVAGSVNAMANSAASAASRMASSMSSGASQAASAVQSQIGRIPGIIAGVGGSAAATAYSVGANISNSFASGMRSALGAINAAAAQMVAAADDAIRAKARIASPSKVFAGLGAYLGEGFEQGIRSTIPDVARAAGNLVSIPGVPHLGADGEYGGVHHHHYYSVTPEDLRRLIENANAGGQFARNFGGELAMMGGTP